MSSSISELFELDREATPRIVTTGFAELVGSGVRSRAFRALPILADDAVIGFIAGVEVSLTKMVADRLGGATRMQDDATLKTLRSAGGSVYFSDIHLLDSMVDDLVTAVRQEVGGEVWTALFVGFGSDGLNAHWDDNDVVAIQLEGSKTWDLSPPQSKSLSPLAERWGPHPSDPREFRCDPGDALVVPAGWRHSTRSEPTGSTHLMVARRSRTVMEELSRQIYRSGITDETLSAPFHGEDLQRYWKRLSGLE